MTAGGRRTASIVQCRTCRLLYRFDLPTRAELSEIYAGVLQRVKRRDERPGYQDYIGDADLDRLDAGRRVERLDTLVGSWGDLLDVGAAAGSSSTRRAATVDRAWDRRRRVDDRSRNRTTWRRRYDDHPRGSAFADQSFHALTMWDYIEHAIDPCGDLDRASTLLRPNGVLGLSTGDAASIVARGSGSRWHLLTPRHPNFFFTRARFTRALDRPAST